LDSNNTEGKGGTGQQYDDEKSYFEPEACRSQPQAHQEHSGNNEPAKQMKAGGNFTYSLFVVRGHYRYQ
jgi:hypothetical protein